MSSKLKMFLSALIIFLAGGAAIVFLFLRTNIPSKNISQISLNETHKSGIFINYLNDARNDSHTYLISSTPSFSEDKFTSVQSNATINETLFAPFIPESSHLEMMQMCRKIMKNSQNDLCSTKNQSMSQSNGHLFNDSSSDALPLNTSIIPMHYDIELRVNAKDENVFEGNVRILLQINETTDLLVLQAGRHVSDITGSRINVFLCSNGEQICVQKALQRYDQQLLLISLSKKILGGTLIVIEVSYFETVIPNNKGLFVQKSTVWEPWLIATLFEKSGTHEVFPSLNQKWQRTTFSLCLVLPVQLSARSNMPITATKNMNDLHKICFASTTSIPSNQFGFAMFDENSMQIVESKNSSVGVQIEIIVGKHLKNTDLHWLDDEIQQTIQKMKNITGQNLFHAKITVVSAALPVNDGSHSSGLILLKSFLLEYPKFARTTTVIVREVVQEWISSALNVCEHNQTSCFQEGLTEYLEWIITEEIKAPNMTAKERFQETRQKILPTEQPRSSSLKSSSECADKMAISLYSLEQFHNRSVVEEFVKNMFKKFSGQTCASVDDIALELSNVMGKEISKHMILSHSVKDDYPVVGVDFSSSGDLKIKDMNHFGNNSHVLPIKIVDDAMESTYHIFNKTALNIYRPSNFVFISPDGYYRSVYNVESYLNFASCISTDKNCAIQFSTAKIIFSDFCWAFLENKLDESKHSQWHLLFNKLINIDHLIEGECSCCIRSKNAAKGKCLWVWRNKCETLTLANNM